MSKTREKVRPLRISSALEQEIKRVSSAIDLNEADTMRKAIERGLPLLEQILASPHHKTSKAA